MMTMKPKLKTIFTTALIVFTSLGVFAADARKPAGTFTYVKGDVQIHPPTSKEWIKVKNSDYFYAQDEIKTGEDGKAEMMFTNGNTIWMSSLSKMTIEDMGKDKINNKDKTKLKLFFGKITNSVEKTLGKNASYEVESSVAVAAVKGTKFSMDQNEGGTDSEISVYEGTVDVAPKAQPENKKSVEQGKSLGVGSDGKTQEKELSEEAKKFLQQLEEQHKQSIKTALKDMMARIKTELNTALKGIAGYRAEPAFLQLKSQTIDMAHNQFEINKANLDDEAKGWVEEVDALWALVELAHKDDVLRASVPAVKTVTVKQDPKSNAVIVAWEAVSHSLVASYRVVRDNQGIWDGNALAYTDTEAVMGKTAKYGVATLDKDGNELSKSEPVSILAKDQIPPAKPAGLMARLTDTGTVALFWDAGLDTDLKHYLVYRDTVKQGEAKDVEYEDKTVKFGDKFDYQVAAVDAAGNISELSDKVNIEINSKEGLAPPTKVKGVLDSATGKITLSWEASKSMGTAAYNVYRNDKLIGSATKTGYTDDLAFQARRGNLDVSPGDSLRYTVKSASVTRQEGDASEEANVELPTDLPEISSMLINGLSTAKITEELIMMQEDLVANRVEVTGTTRKGSYGLDRIEVRTNPSEPWLKATGTDSWTYYFVPLNDTHYQVQARAIDVLGKIQEQDSNDAGKLHYTGVSKIAKAKDLVKNLIDAFNANNIDSMMNFVSTDFDPDSQILKQEAQDTLGLYESVTIVYTPPDIMPISDTELDASLTWERSFRFKGQTVSQKTAKQTCTLRLIWQPQSLSWALKRLSGPSMFKQDTNAPVLAPVVTSPVGTVYPSVAASVTLPVRWTISTPINGEKSITLRLLQGTEERLNQSFSAGTRSYNWTVNTALGKSFTVMVTLTDYMDKSATATKTFLVSGPPDPVNGWK